MALENQSKHDQFTKCPIAIIRNIFTVTLYKNRQSLPEFFPLLFLSLHFLPPIPSPFPLSFPPPSHPPLCDGVPHHDSGWGNGWG